MLESLDWEVFYSLTEGGVEHENVKHGGTGYNSPPETQTPSHQLTNEQRGKKHHKRFMRPNFMPVHSDPTNSVLLTSLSSYSKYHTCHNLHFLTLAVHW